MRVVLSRFFNESYLMEWWLRHHLEMFDHGILIDSNSNDETADICRTIAPHWEVIRTEHAEYSAILADFELMKQEERFPEAWKIVLNTTEFLVSPDLFGPRTLHCRAERDRRRSPRGNHGGYRSGIPARSAPGPRRAEEVRNLGEQLRFRGSGNTWLCDTHAQPRVSPLQDRRVCSRTTSILSSRAG